MKNVILSLGLAMLTLGATAMTDTGKAEPEVVRIAKSLQLLQQDVMAQHYLNGEISPLTILKQNHGGVQRFSLPKKPTDCKMIGGRANLFSSPLIKGLDHSNVELRFKALETLDHVVYTHRKER